MFVYSRIAVLKETGEIDGWVIKGIKNEQEAIQKFDEYYATKDDFIVFTDYSLKYSFSDEEWLYLKYINNEWIIDKEKRYEVITRMIRNHRWREINAFNIYCTMKANGLEKPTEEEWEQIVSWYNLWLDLPSVVEYDSDKALWEYIPDLSLRHERLTYYWKPII